MSSWIGVVANPYFAVSDDHGRFSINGMPAGHYTLSAWHEVFGGDAQDVDVGADGTAMVNFTLHADNAKK
jgi:hypothetical protein